MPLELVIHAATCPTRRRPCECEKRTFDAATQAETAREAHGGDVTRMELSYQPPVHMHTIPVERSQARRHRREIAY